MIRFAENLNKMIAAGLGGALEAPRTEVAVGHHIRYLESSGAVASFETNIVAPIRSLRVDMRPIQAGSGDPSPENIRPITGRDAVTVYHSGEDITYYDSITVQLGQTVYGGTVDVTTGTMTVDMAYFEMQTAKTSDWGKSRSYPGGFYITRNAFKIDDIALKDNTPFLCSHAKSVSKLADYVYGTCYCDTSMNFRLMDGDATVSDWVAYLQEQKNNGTPVVACGLLATPLTIPLTAQQMSTIKGQNNVWSDAGDVTLEYPCSEETEGY